MAEKKHSELSPSTTERWWNCPGSIKACRGLKQVESEYAKEGTVAHEVLERSLKNKLHPSDLVGLTIEGLEVTNEMADAVTVAYDFIRSELQMGGNLLCESRVVVADTIAGTLDAAIIKPFDKITVIDYKHGAGILVSAEHNYQMLCYAIGLLKQYEADTIELIIIQPRSPNEEKISRWVCDKEYIETFEAELYRHIELTKEKAALINSGSWCKFCLAKPTCPELRGEISQALEVVENTGLIFPDAKGLALETITKILDYKELIEEWLDSVSGYALTLLENGALVPGYELAKKRGNRKWVDEKEVIKQYTDTLGEKLYNVKLISPAQLEKLIGKEKKDELKTLTEVPDNGFTIKKSDVKKGVKNGK